MAASLINRLPAGVKIWSTPRQLVIQDWRLGLLSLFLTFLVLIFICVQLLVNKMYAVDHVPGGYITFWFESGDMGSHLDSGTKSYCNSSEYNYVYNQRQPLGNQYWNDMDINCLAFPYGTLTSTSGSQGFVATLLKRERVKSTDCSGTAAASSCDLPLLHSVKGSDPAGARVVTNARSTNNGKDQCSCGVLEDYFAIGVEMMTLYVDHHFTTDGTMDRITGSSTSRQGHEDTTQVKRLYTCVKKSGHTGFLGKIPKKVLSLAPAEADLTGCVYEQLPGEDTLGMKLAEWLDLAGVSLDERLTQDVVTADKITKKRPFRRMTGTRLKIEINYYADFFSTKDDSPVLAVLHVENIDGWSSMGSQLEYANFEPLTQEPASGPCPGSAGCAMQEYMDYYRRGIRVEFKSQGSVRRFDAQAVYLFFVSSVVMLGFVDQVVGIVTFKLHPNRKVFYKAANEPLSYKKELAIFGTETALACQAFKQWDKSNDPGKEPSISVEELAGVFRGSFSEEEAKQLARVVIDETVGEGKELTCKDLAGLMSSELVSMEILMLEAKKNEEARKRIGAKVIPSREGSDE